MQDKTLIIVLSIFSVLVSILLNGWNGYGSEMVIGIAQVIFGIVTALLGFITLLKPALGRSFYICVALVFILSIGHMFIGCGLGGGC